MSVRVLVVGGGGREHTLAWKLSQSDAELQVYVTPGNAGTATLERTANVGQCCVSLYSDLLSFM